MLQELEYTSAKRGLIMGTSGYCTVKATARMPGSVRSLLESLSTYRYLVDDPRSSDNPVAVSYLSASVASSTWHVLSRIGAAPLDHSGRSNYFAHHLAMPAREWAGLDPAWLASHPDLLHDVWDERLQEIEQARSLPRGQEIARVCERWQSITGDAGWAGVVAQALQEGTRACLVFQAGMPVLPLVREVFSVLPAEARPRTTFSTYFCGVPAQVECQLRCVVAGSKEHASMRGAGVTVIDLASCGSIRNESEWVERARTGQEPPRKGPAAVVAPVPTPTWQPTDAGPLPSPHAVPAPALAVGTKVPPAPQLKKRPFPAIIEPEQPDRGMSWWGALAGVGIGVLLGAIPILPFLITANRERTSLGDAVAKLDSQRKEIMNDRDNLRAELDAFKKKSDSGKSARQDLDNQKNEENRKYRETLNLLAQEKEEVKRLNDTNRDLSNTISAKQADLDKLASEKEQLAKEKGNLTTEKETLEKEKGTVENNLAEAKKKLAKFEKPDPNSKTMANPSEASGEKPPMIVYRLPILPALEPAQNAVILQELKTRTKTLELRDAPSIYSLKEFVASSWDLQANGKTVARFSIPPKADPPQVRFKWEQKEHSVAEIQAIRIDLAKAYLATSDGTQVRLGEDRKEPAPASSPTPPDPLKE